MPCPCMHAVHSSLVVVRSAASTQHGRWNSVSMSAQVGLVGSGGCGHVVEVLAWAAKGQVLVASAILGGVGGRSS